MGRNIFCEKVKKGGFHFRKAGLLLMASNGPHDATQISTPKHGGRQMQRIVSHASYRNALSLSMWRDFTGCGLANSQITKPGQPSYTGDLEI